MRFESRRGPKRRKKKSHSVNWKAYFSSFYFFINPFPLHFKANFKSLRQCSHHILNHSKWSTYHEDVNKCSVIGRQLMMGWSTLASVKNRKFVPMKFPAFELTPQINTLLNIPQNVLASLEPVQCVGPNKNYSNNWCWTFIP